jgi:hypothetical protein
MTQLQEHKLERYLSFREYLNQNPLALEQYPLLKPHYETFLNYLNLILKTKETMEESIKCTCNYNLLKEDLIKVVLSISRKVTAYSLLEELTDIQGMFCYTYEELSQATDEKILKKCQNLLQFILKYNKELIDYGIDANLEKNLRDLTDQFHLVLETKNIYTETSVASNEHFTYLINETDEIYEKKLVTISSGITINPLLD